MTKLIGYLIIMMSGLTISIEIYVLKIIYVMSYGVIPEWKPDSSPMGTRYQNGENFCVTVEIH